MLDAPAPAQREPFFKDWGVMAAFAGSGNLEFGGFSGLEVCILRD